MTYSQLISVRIRQLCEIRHISTNKLSKMSGVSQSTLDNILHGHSQNPKSQTLHRIALAFSMTYPEFLHYPEMLAYSFEDEDGVSKD